MLFLTVPLPEELPSLAQQAATTIINNMIAKIVSIICNCMEISNIYMISSKSSIELNVRVENIAKIVKFFKKSWKRK